MQKLKRLQKTIELLQQQILSNDRLGILKLRQSVVKEHGYIQWQYIMERANESNTEV